MLCKELISNLIPALSTKDTPNRALQIMDEYHLSQLPILQADNYIGMVLENELLDLDVTDKPFHMLHFECIQAAIPQDAHIYEALKLVKDFKLNIIPVVTEDRKYLGSISQENLLQELANGTQYAKNGGVIVLGIEENNYSLSQIARIAESDNINIWSVNLSNAEDGQLLITLKTNKQDVRSLVASLERFNYQILEVHSLHNDNLDVQDNYESFMKYINM
jgi:acetoin utilization protein AcuB